LFDLSPPGLFEHNLPAQLTSFVGRVQEIADIRRELAKARLLTLAGPGGVGKTRLALRVAGDELGSYANGVWFVELASVAEGSLVAQTVANLFALRETPEESLTTSLARTLESRHLLLILDNCEHVLAATTDLVHRLLRACPHIVVLTTSREVLGLAGETVWRVPPMQLPESNAGVPVEHVTDYEAAALFVERAQAFQPDFSATAHNTPALLEVCRRVDGIPLAIELAASRVGVLSVEEIAERLRTHFRFLSSRDPAVQTRQQTLERTIRWSHDLLTQTERHLFDRLSVFAGGCSFEAMESVVGNAAVNGDDLLDVLHRLIDKSLVVVDHPPRALRAIGYWSLSGSLARTGCRSATNSLKPRSATPRFSSSFL
jgi:non-specific serine/threonine protein kinase